MNSSITITNFPQISATQKKRVLVGVRPFRKGGIRLQKQQIKDKTIVHNYGHGGAGVSLAPATAQQTAELVSTLCSKGQSVSVIGSGIIGLMSALQCAAKGYKVTVYADRIPVQGQSDVSVMCTSEIAPGYWLPYHYEFSDQKQHDRRSERSYLKYIQYAKTSKSMRKIQVFQDMDLKQIKQKAPQFVSNTCKNVNVKIDTKQFPMVYFETLQIHLQQFLQELIKKCQQKGVKFESRQFDNIQEVLKLPTKVIVNCMGLGSKKVFKDENMYGVKGHLIQINNSSKIKGIFGFKYQGEPVKMYCFDDKILLGLTKEYSDANQMNQKLAESLEQRAYNFYKSLGLSSPKPKL